MIDIDNFTSELLRRIGNANSRIKGRQIRVPGSFPERVEDSIYWQAAYEMGRQTVTPLICCYRDGKCLARVCKGYKIPLLIQRKRIPVFEIFLREGTRRFSSDPNEVLSHFDSELSHLLVYRE